MKNFFIYFFLNVPLKRNDAHPLRYGEPFLPSSSSSAAPPPPLPHKLNYFPRLYSGVASRHSDPHYICCTRKRGAFISFFFFIRPSFWFYFYSSETWLRGIDGVALAALWHQGGSRCHRKCIKQLFNNLLRQKKKKKIAPRRIHLKNWRNNS